MLQLPQITLLAIDCINPGRTLQAMKFSTRFVRFGRTVLLTDTGKHRKIEPQSSHFPGLEIAHIVESDVKKAPFPGHSPLPVDYEMDSLTKPIEYIRGSHVLFMEWDSAVLNPLAWRRDWLDWDLTAAPWPEHTDPGWPPCTEVNCMGNGGFSLRSRKFCELTARSTKEFKGDPQMLSSDRWFGRSIRPWMESNGVKYAPWQDGMRFSCENLPYASSFGFHGKMTAAINNWGGTFLGSIRPK